MRQSLFLGWGALEAMHFSLHQFRSSTRYLISQQDMHCSAHLLVLPLGLFIHFHSVFGTLRYWIVFTNNRENSNWLQPWVAKSICRVNQEVESWTQESMVHFHMSILNRHAWLTPASCPHHTYAHCKVGDMLLGWRPGIVRCVFRRRRLFFLIESRMCEEHRGAMGVRRVRFFFSFVFALGQEQSKF